MTVHRIETQFAGRPLILETGRLAKQAAGSAYLQFGDTAVLAAVTVSPNRLHSAVLPPDRRVSREDLRRGQDPGRVPQARGPAVSDKEILAGAGDRPVDPAALPRGLQERGPGLRHRALRRPGERCRRARRRGRLGGAERLVGAVERSDRGGAGGPGGRQLDPQSDLPAARILDPRRDGERQRRFDRDGRRRRAARSPRPRCSRRSRWRRRASRSCWATSSKIIAKAGEAQAGLDQGRARRGPGQAGRGRWPKADMAKAINAKDKHARAAQRRGAQGARSLQALADRVPRGGQARSQAMLEDIEYRVMRAQVLDKGERVDGRDGDTIRPITIEAGLLPRTHGSALFQRGETQALVAVTLGTAGRRAADRQHRPRGRDHEVVHAALQLPALFDRRSEDDARHQPPRDRPRRPGRAGAAAAAAGLREVPLHPAGRLGDPGVQRLVLDGHGLRRLAGADGCRRADEGAPAPASRWG